MTTECRLETLGLTLPAAPKVPPHIKLSFAWTRVRGNRVYISGQSALHADGTPAGPFGKVPSEVTLEQAAAAARQTALAMLGSLKRSLDDLDRVSAWLMVYGMVNADPGYPHTTLVINGFSDLIVELYGEEIGHHARIAVGMAALPMNNAVVIAAEVEIDGLP